MIRPADSSSDTGSPAIDDLHERADDLAVLRAALDDARGGHGALVVVEGEAGAGKSRLLRRIADLGRASGCSVLAARGHELESDFPFGTVRAMFEPVLVDLEPDERGESFHGAAGLARPLFAYLDGAPYDDLDRSAPGSLNHGLYWLTSNLARGAPTVVIVDDAHWADLPSLRFLSYGIDRVTEIPVLVVVALRPDDPRSTAAPLAGLRAHPSVRTVRPAPLSATAVGEIVRGAFEHDVAEAFSVACANATGGNPFLVHALIDALRAEAVAPTAENASRVSVLAPATVLRSVLARLAGLPTGTIEVAGAVAVLGDAGTVAQVAELTGRPLRETETLADALAREGLLVRGTPLVFAHPLIRATVIDDIPPLRRARLHRQAAEILRADGAPAEAIAAHLIAGSRGESEPWAVAVLRQAATIASRRGDPAGAAALLSCALEEPVDPSQRGSVLAELGQAQATSGAPEAERTLTQALDLTDDREQRVVLHHRLGNLLWAQARRSEARQVFARGVDEGGPDSPGARELRAALAVSFNDGAGREALSQLEWVVDVPAGEETHAERTVLAVLALRKSLLGDPVDEVQAIATRAWGDGALLRDDGPGGHFWPHTVTALTWSDGHVQAGEYADQGLRAAQASGSVLAFGTASFLRAMTRYWAGDVDEALSDAARAHDTRARGWEAWVLPLAWIEAKALLLDDRPDEAERVLDATAEPAAALQESLEVLSLLDARAELYLLRGAPDDALATYLELGQRSEQRFAITNPLVLPWHAGAALAAAQLGDREQALALLAAGSRLTERQGSAASRGRLRWTAGVVHGGADGLAMIEDAVRGLEGTDARLEHLRALIELGAARRRGGEVVGSREPLARAREIAHGMGARALARRATDELRAAGGRPRRIALSGADSLTASERRLADLAADGLTNRAIAQIQFVTVKSVEFHLRNAYRKLGIQARDELALALGREQRTAEAEGAG